MARIYIFFFWGGGWSQSSVLRTSFWHLVSMGVQQFCIVRDSDALLYLHYILKKNIYIYIYIYRYRYIYIYIYI